MPIIKPCTKPQKEIVRVSLDVETINKVREYCEWLEIKKIDEFFQQAAEFILTKDKDWITYDNRKNSGRNLD